MPGLALSVVIPVLNEEENLETLYTQLRATLDNAALDYELIFVDDGSTARSFEILRSLQQGDPHMRVVRLRRNYGQTAAFAAAFDRACGEAIVTLDADLQNDPADIPALVAKLEEGYDVVSGWRVDRHDRFLDRRLPSIVANRLIGWVTGVRIHDYGCSLKAYRRDVLADVRLYGELHRFIPALAHGQGARVVEMPVRHHPRHGRSYPLYFMTPNTKNRIHSQFNNLEMIRSCSPAPEVTIHPDDAAERGIAEGALVRIFNDRGELFLPARIDNGLKAGCVCVTNGWWISEGGTVNFCSLGRETDLGHGAAFHDNLVDVEVIGHA